MTVEGAAMPGRPPEGGKEPLRSYRMLIGGEWCAAADGGTFESDDPYKGGPWALLPRAGTADVDRAVAAALRRLPSPRPGAASAPRHAAPCCTASATSSPARPTGWR